MASLLTTGLRSDSVAPVDGINSTEQVGVIKLLLTNCTRSRAFLYSEPCGCILLSETALILEPDINLRQGQMARNVKNRCHREFF